jgi:hypothetical protein
LVPRTVLYALARMALRAVSITQLQRVMRSCTHHLPVNGSACQSVVKHLEIDFWVYLVNIPL